MDYFLLWPWFSPVDFQVGGTSFRRRGTCSGEDADALYDADLFEGKFRGANVEPSERNYEGHWAIIKEAAREGVFIAAEPLSPTRSATTIRVANGKTVIIDGPFAETKEQLAGYYIFNCRNLDQAIEWAEKISTACNRAESVEIRPMPGMPEPLESGSLD